LSPQAWVADVGSPSLFYRWQYGLFVLNLGNALVSGSSHSYANPCIWFRPFDLDPRPVLFRSAPSGSFPPVLSDPSHVLSCPVLFRFALSCPVLFRFVLSCSVLFCPVLSCSVLFCPVLSCSVLFCPVLSCSVRSCLFCFGPSAPFSLSTLVHPVASFLLVLSLSVPFRSDSRPSFTLSTALSGPGL